MEVLGALEEMVGSPDTEGCADELGRADLLGPAEGR